MPEIKKGETQKEWIARCVPYLMEKEGKTREQALGQCYGMWRQKHPNADDSEWIAELNQEQLFTCDISFEYREEKIESENCDDCDEEQKTKVEHRRMVAIVGDRFMNGGFFSYELLKQVYNEWEGTLHDINHMGTTKNPTTDPRPDITYFVGYHTNVSLDENNKSVSMDIKINPKTRFAEAWEGYIELCKAAGKIPNVSVTYFGQRKFVKVSDLPDGVDYESEGYSKNDYVPYLTNVTPVCVSTVLMGRCNDRQGCGIGNTDSCGDEEQTKELENKREEMIEKIKTLKEKLNYD